MIFRYVVSQKMKELQDKFTERGECGREIEITVGRGHIVSYSNSPVIDAIPTKGALAARILRMMFQLGNMIRGNREAPMYLRRKCLEIAFLLEAQSPRIN